MKNKQWKKIGIILSFLALAAIALSGCSSGKDGATGATGPAGPSAGADAAVMSTETMAALNPTVTVDSVTISSPPVVKFTVKDAKGNGISGLGFTTKAATATLPGLSNLSFNLAKLVPGADGAPSKWVSYIVTTVPTVAAPTVVPCQPTTETTGTLVDNGKGSYTYTFYRDITKVKDVVAAATVTAPSVLADLGDLTYDPKLTHRLVILLRGTVRGTGTNTADGSDSGVAAVSLANPKYIIYDFVPSTGKTVTATDTQRVITTNEACASCHSTTPGHRGSDVRNCVMCHNDQIKYSRAAVTSAVATAAKAATKTTKTDATTGVVTVTETLAEVVGDIVVTGTKATATNPTTGVSTVSYARSYRIDGETLANFPIMIHKIHMGTRLKKKGYGYNVVGLYLKDLTYTQSPMNCTKCHVGDTAAQLAAAPQGNNWKSAPSRLACGSCHDGINWATGGGTTIGKVAVLGTTYAGHFMGGAQTTDKDCVLCHKEADIATYHTTANSTPLNLAVPKDANGKDASVFTYEIKTVTANGSNQPVVTFRILEKIGTAAAKAITLRPYTGTAGTPGVDATGTAAYYANIDGNSGLYAGFTGNPAFLVHFSTTGGVDFDNQGSGSIRNYPGQPALSVFLADLMTGTGGTITGPDADGYYTATLKNANAHSSSVAETAAGTYTNADGTKGAASPAVTALTNYANLGKITTTIPVSYPVGAKMRAVQMLGNFTQVNLGNPYVWTKIVPPVGTTNGVAASGGLSRGVPTVVKYVTGDTARRSVITMAKCRSCHEEGLGHQTPLDMANCVTCHNPMLAANVSTAALASAGWGFKPLIHTAHTELNALENNNKCEICHVAGTYSSVPTGALPSTTIATYVQTTADSTILPGIRVSTGVTVNLDTDKITSPYSSACLSCHTSTDAANHAKVNGALVNEARSMGGGAVVGGLTTFVSAEACGTCHGTGKTYDVIEVHK